jgi:glycosyltransferase involved in cell wall biosynthesis
MLLPVVTVIITTYNRAGLISEAVGSVLLQTFTDFELLVVDNGSTDNTREVIGGFKDDRVKYMYNETPSGSCAMPRNIGARAAAGRYLAFLDDDDIWYPKKLEICVDILNEDGEAALVCHAVNIAKDGEIMEVRHFGPWSEDIYERLIYKGNLIGPTSVMIKKQALLELGGFNVDEKYLHCDDYEFWIRLAKTGARFQFIDDVLGEFRVTGHNMSMKYQFQLKPIEMIREVIMSREGGKVYSARAKMRLVGMCLNVIRDLLSAGSYGEALKFYLKVTRLGYMDIGSIMKKLAAKSRTVLQALRFTVGFRLP